MSVVAKPNPKANLKLVGLLSLLSCIAFVVGNLITAGLMWWWGLTAGILYFPPEVVRSIVSALIGLFLLHAFVGGEFNGLRYAYSALGISMVLTFVWVLATISIIFIGGIGAAAASVVIYSGLQVAVWWAGVWFGYVRYIDPPRREWSGNEPD